MSIGLIGLYYLLRTNPTYVDKTVYTLKPFNWGSNRLTTATHSYTILYDSKERAYITTYFEFASCESGTHQEESVQASIDWVEQVHIPAKLTQYFNKETVKCLK